MLLPNLDDLRFLFVTGKGGVGKTTVTAALARALARRNRRVLVCSCNAKDRLSLMFGSSPIGHEIVHVAPNIDAVNIVPQRAIEEYGLMTLKIRSLYRAVFENRYVTSFLHAVPGIFEWAMLGKAWFHTTELISGKTTSEREPPFFDGWKYEVVIVDAPATGHGVDMLRVPRIILDVAPSSHFRKEAERAWTLFQDQKHAGIILVTLPEDMPANETSELVNEIRSLRLPIARLVINGMLPTLFSEDEHHVLVEKMTHPCFEAARARAIREEIQESAIRKLSLLQLPTVQLPLLFDVNPAEPRAIVKLSTQL